MVSSRERGTVVLVALCFVAVLGLMLASYLAVSSRAMQLSNRSLQSEQSRQLAEAGIEEALRAFNQNDWDDWSSSGMSVDWDTTTYAASKRAVATISFPSGKFAQGTTATVKVRVDNFDGEILSSDWSASSINYRINDLVGHSGTWYRCVQNHTSSSSNGPPNFAYWAPEPIRWAWTSNITYTAYHDIVCHQGSWWLCTSTHSSTSSFDWSRWTWVPAPDSAWAASTWYNAGAFVYRTSNQTWYRCTTAHFSTATFDTSKFSVASWSYQSSRSYSFNDVVNYNGTWYRYIYQSSLSGYTPSSYPSVWQNAYTGMWNWNSSSVTYHRGDTVYYSSNGQWYRCIRPHTSSASISPTNSTYWVNSPLSSTAWDAGKQYSANDVVRYAGVWYRCVTPNNNSNPSSSSDWTSAALNANQWNSSANYAVGNYVSYGSVWYRCTATPTNRESPNTTSCWKAIGAPVIYSQAVVTLGDQTFAQTQLRAPIASAPLFPNAVAAMSRLTITGGTGTVDSYSSQAGSYGGANIGYSAVLAAGTSVAAGISTLLSIGDGTIVKGYVAATPQSTAPYAPRASFGTSAQVKSSSSPGTLNVDLSQISASPYIPDFPILDSRDGTRLQNVAATLGTPGATTPSIYYYQNSSNSYNLTLNGSSEVITVVGPVILNVYGNLRINTSAAARIRITPTGSLRLNVSRDFRLESTGGGIENQTLDPSKLSVFCIRVGSDTFEINTTNSDFIGTVYVPDSSSALTIASNVAIYGALSAQSITFSGAANVHYDTSLRYATFPGVDQPYTVTELRELPAGEQATMP